MSYARTAVTRMTLDMSRLDLQRSETVTQGDTNRRWEVTLINGGAPFRLPPNWTAALTGIKPDGTGLLNGCSVADGKIIYDFAAGAEIATCAGSYPVQFDIWDEVGDLVASPKLYVNVLEDVRPREGIKSESEYGLLGEFIAQKNELIADVTSNTTQIGDLIGRVNQTDADVDLLGETALAQGDDIAALKEKVTTSGMVTIPVEEWSGAGPHEALVRLGDNPISKGCIVLLAPEDNATKEAAGAARMSVYNVIDSDNSYGDFVMVVRAESGIKPTVPLNFRFAVIKTDTEDTAIAAMVGVDAYGEGGASGVDADAVKQLIRDVVPAWARESNPPEDAVKSVNGETGAVTLYIPSTAAEVGAEKAGAVGTHNNSVDAHGGIRVDVTNLQTDFSALVGTDTGKTIRAIAALVIAESLASGGESFDSLQEIAAWIKDHPSDVSAMVKRIDDLKTDMGGKVSTADIINNLTTNATNKPLSAAQGVALKTLIDDLDAEIPTELPNPKAITILGKTYTGATAVSVTIDDILAVLPVYNGEVAEV